MELAKVTVKGQITIPISIRKKLGIKEGDKVVFLENGENIIIANSAMVALKKAQEAFKGEAEKNNLKTEQDVVDMIKDIRKDMMSE